MLPTAHPTSLTLSRPARSQSVRELRLIAADFAERAGLSRSHDVALAVSEAATNVVVHAYPEGAGPIRLALEVAEDALVVVVEDEGVGLRPRPDSPGLGLGLPTMAQVADRIQIDDGAGNGVRVELRFRFDG